MRGDGPEDLKHLKQRLTNSDGLELLSRVKRLYEVQRKLHSGEYKLEDATKFIESMRAGRNELSAEILKWSEEDKRILPLIGIMVDLYRLLQGTLYELGGCTGLDRTPQAISHLSDLSRSVAFSMKPNLDPVFDHVPEAIAFLRSLATEREKTHDSTDNGSRV